MKPMLSVFMLAAACAAQSEAQAAGSLLRMVCEDDAVRAEVSINGVFKGECPIDVQVNAGTIQLRVLKKIDASSEQVFNDEFRIGEDAVKKIEVKLSEPRLNAEAQRGEDARLALEHAKKQKREEAHQMALANEQRLLQAALQQQQKAAESGDSVAMAALGERYANGNGVSRSDEQANLWYRKAAAAGNEVAAFKLSNLNNKTITREDLAAVVRMLELPVENERNLNITGHDNVRAFVASDPFFNGSGGNQKISYSYVRRIAEINIHMATTCQRNGNLFLSTYTNKFDDNEYTGEGNGLLGGLIWLDAKTSHGWFSSTSSEIATLEKVHGQPFPLTLGKRFGVKYAATEKGTYASAGLWSSKITCAVTDVKVKAVGQMQIPEAAQQIICLTEGVTLQPVSRWYWHEGSGCLVNAGTQ